LKQIPAKVGSLALGSMIDRIFCLVSNCRVVDKANDMRVLRTRTRTECANIRGQTCRDPLFRPKYRTDTVRKLKQGSGICKRSRVEIDKLCVLEAPQFGSDTEISVPLHPNYLIRAQPQLCTLINNFSQEKNSVICFEFHKFTTIPSSLNHH
jgi:hypothetical protein